MWRGPANPVVYVASATTAAPCSSRPSTRPALNRALYEAPGWMHVGTTLSRRHYDRQTKRDQPKKDIWLQHFRKDLRRNLNR